MTDPTYKAPMIRHMLEVQSITAFGRSAVKSIEQDICVRCGKPAKEFKDEVSKKEYAITGMCQECQDLAWGLFEE